jgi:hypothetical protein
MESQPESTSFSEWARSVEPWVLPAIAAIVVGGTILLCMIIGICWLAARPARQPIVIWMLQQPGFTSSDQPRSVHVQSAHTTKDDGHVATD